MTDFRHLLQTLSGAGVDFILVGGAAATAHGSARLTADLDIVYERSKGNIVKLAAALASSKPYLRGAPPGLPFRWEADTIERGLNFTLTTSMGDLDILGEITGGGPYEKLLPHCVGMTVFGVKVLCLGLEHLIRAKRAAGRPKDLEAIAELEAILEERQRAH